MIAPGEAPGRRLNLGDFMVLLPALAAGLMLSLDPLGQIGSRFAAISRGQAWNLDAWWVELLRHRGPRFLIIYHGTLVLAMLFVPLTPTLILVRLRRPRPSLRRIAFQPGFAACATASVAVLIMVDLAYLGIADVPPGIIPLVPGASVLPAWSALALARRWDPEASWVDRAGRLVGVFWIAMIPWAFWLLPG